MYFKELTLRFKEYSVVNYKKGTNVTRFSIVNKYLDPYFGEYEIEDITVKDIDNFFNLLKNSNLRQNTLFGIYVCMLSIFKLAKNEGLLVVSPMDESEEINRE